ncbi:putative fructosyl amino acid protein [Lasiosphaeria miniovina]|uniref:Fructosyl amino acid protein n=1 Tax=Lasiosphaeria miniovina TaxID=1954250 RepID=A0AA40DND1_9PEZI|nr:putative fructosyl amino acid protein [Lasiosphaeria miniovina]KAK0709550.1 putative fructosyl amino acid protein [Lasiosphaeria miniovina]
MTSSSPPLPPLLCPSLPPSPLLKPASASASEAPFAFSPPSSIIIIGSGVFGLGTAWALARRPAFSQCSITVVDRSDPSQSRPDVFPAPDAASVDTSRIIRADYYDAAYAALAAEAQVHWREQAKPTDLGAQGRYNESGLVLVADLPHGTAVPPSPPGAETAVAQHAAPAKKKTGMDYARGSWANVLSLASNDPSLTSRIHELPNAAAIRDAVGTGGGSGSWGYINEASGWADAGASMAWLVDRVQDTGRVKFVAATALALEHQGTTVTGAKLSDGCVLSAELVVVAAGAWTGGLIDLAGQATATGQVLGYLDITEAEQEQLGRMPALLNLTTGLFVIPPAKRVLKVARHAYGYLNPTKLATAPLPSSSAGSASALAFSHPLTHLSDLSLAIPKEGADDLRRALGEMVPLPGLRDRPFSKTRLCWYMDTPTADFLIDYHPNFQGLFVATGGSGHAFKFMPVIGDKIVDCMMHNCPRQFEGKWAWKPVTTTGGTVWSSVVTEDGTRGGTPGLVLADELVKGVTRHYPSR